MDTTQKWGICSKCHLERRLFGGRVIDHRVYVDPLDGMLGWMEECPGSGRAPDA